MKNTNKSDTGNKGIGGNVFTHIDTLDLRPIIKTVAACLNIKEIKYIDTLILPKNRDDDTMSAISGIKMSFVDTILYLDDNESIDDGAGIKYKNSPLAEIFEKDFSSAKVNCANCAVIAIHAISNIDVELPRVKFTNIANIFMDNSLKKCASSFEFKNVAVINYCDLPENANVKLYNNENLLVNSEKLKTWGANALLIFNNCKVDFDDNITAEEFASYKFLLVVTSTNIKVGKKLRNTILNNSICNNAKIKRK